MVCIYCSAKTDVINSRHQKRLNQVWRRRHCSNCSTTFTTHEVLDLENALSVRKDGNILEPFVREQLFISIHESCKHRPSAIADATGLTRTVVARLLSLQQQSPILDRQRVVLTTEAVLRNFDQVAATMYAAYHR